MMAKYREEKTINNSIKHSKNCKIKLKYICI